MPSYITGFKTEFMIQFMMCCTAYCSYRDAPLNLDLYWIYIIKIITKLPKMDLEHHKNICVIRSTLPDGIKLEISKFTSYQLSFPSTYPTLRRVKYQGKSYHEEQENWVLYLMIKSGWNYIPTHTKLFSTPWDWSIVGFTFLIAALMPRPNLQVN